LGEIRVRLQRGEWIPTMQGKRSVQRRTVKGSVGRVHERVKKVRTVCVIIPKHDMECVLMKVDRVQWI
jgi:hypothetical protein